MCVAHAVCVYLLLLPVIVYTVWFQRRQESNTLCLPMSCVCCCSMYDPSVLSVYSGLKTAVERSDLWRYVVMCKHGGVYTDADTLCVRPIQVHT